MVKQAKDYIGFDVNFPNDFLRETEYIISLSLDSKEVREWLNGNGNNEPKLDNIATNYEKKLMVFSNIKTNLTVLFGVHLLVVELE